MTGAGDEAPHYLARGGEHLVYELHDRVVKIDHNTSASIMKWRAPRRLPGLPRAELDFLPALKDRDSPCRWRGMLPHSWPGWLTLHRPPDGEVSTP